VVQAAEARHPVLAVHQQIVHPQVVVARQPLKGLLAVGAHTRRGLGLEDVLGQDGEIAEGQLQADLERRDEGHHAAPARGVLRADAQALLLGQAQELAARALGVEA